MIENPNPAHRESFADHWWRGALLIVTVAASGLSVGAATSIPAFLLMALLGEVVPALKEYGLWLWGGLMVLALPAALGAGLPRMLPVIFTPFPRRA